MKSYVLAASVAVLATASESCDNYTTWDDLEKWDVRENCLENFQPNDCVYICNLGHCDSWWISSEIEQACWIAQFLGVGRNKRSSANVTLASKGVHSEAESSNAAYYIAGASVLSAAAVAYVIANKKGQKTVEQPLIAHDDEFKVFM